MRATQFAAPLCPPKVTDAPGSLMSEVVTIGDATLYHGDASTIVRTAMMPAVDAFVTDPPYGVNLGRHRAAEDDRTRVLTKAGYESYDDTLENLRAVVVPVVAELVARVGRGIVFCADKNIWEFPRAVTVGAVYMPAGCGRNQWGFANLAHCLMYGGAPDLHRGARATALLSTETSVANGHPCPKPEGWMRWVVNLASRAGESVLDPFMGSGTTGVACAQLGRKFIGIEIERKYFDIACERIDNAYRQQRMFA
jgi:site-specific DNA-methyltransferase (adenine-specific)